MATRTIVTSQPDVGCDVCERRLLRGEHAEVFLADGRRRTVCELCAPRAAHEGWVRESESNSLTLPPARPRRGRSLLERLPVPFRVRQVGPPAYEPALASEPAPSYGEPAQAAGELRPAGPYDFLDAGEGRHGGGEQTAAGAEHPVAGGAGLAQAASEASYAEHAVAVFNASEYPRRIAGVARSLGAPEVNVSEAEHLASVVRIVVAWELCWYRYEVDLSEEQAEAQVQAQGAELSELERFERRVNAVADERGTLALVAAEAGASTP